MSKIFILLFIFFLLSNCSLDTKSGIWTKTKELKVEKQLIEKEIFQKKKIYENELNSNLKIKLKQNFNNRSFINNQTNNNGIINFNGTLQKISKYKFSKISKFDYFQPELLLTNKNSIIFFDDKGTVLNFDENSKLLWKNNIYSKTEKKLKPILYFGSDNKNLIVADNIAKYYAMNINNGELVWSKSHIAPFNSQIKIFNDKFFVIDFDNVLRCYSIKNGEEIWSFKTDKSFIKSQQKLSLIVSDTKVIFINTLGDVSAIDISSGNLLWQTPTQSSSIYENSFSLQNSDLIAENNSIYFSNNKNEFFALDERTGVVRWKQTINSNLRPTISDGVIFTVTMEGYLAVIDARNGNIVRITNVFDQLKNYKKNKVEPVGFIVTKEKIYLSLNVGKLITIDIATGKSIDILKIDNEKISRPYVLNSNMFIVKNNAVLKLN